jgi:hypothetical protein
VIPRWQQVVFWALLLSIAGMAAYLIRLRSRAEDRLLAVQEQAPVLAADDAPQAPVTLLVASDFEGALLPVQRFAPLPEEPTAHAKAVLDALFTEYASPESPHPLAARPAVDTIYLVPVPAPAPASAPAPDPALDAASAATASGSITSAATASTPAAQAPDSSLLAVVNFNGDFVSHHPSGIEVENLTLLSVVSTLHANLPRITRVHFLVDGQSKDTLAGHADLTQDYLAASTPAASANPVSEAQP